MADTLVAHDARTDNTFTVEICRAGGGSKLAALIVAAPDAATAWHRASQTISGYPNLYPGRVCPILQDDDGQWRVGGGLARGFLVFAIGLFMVACGAAAAVLKVAEGVQAAGIF